MAELTFDDDLEFLIYGQDDVMDGSVKSEDVDGNGLQNSSSSSSSSSTSGSKKGGKDELDAKAWLKRRREQIAKASRKAREKRKHKVQELQKENDKLKEERAVFLQKIQELQTKISELRSNGQIDTHLENELLKAQLQEHKRFLSGCFKLHHGLPSSDNTLRNLRGQGSSFAQTYVHSLISRSVTENWEPTKFPKHIPRRRLIPGYNVTMCHRFVESPKKCLNIRIDVAVKGVSLETFAELQWKMWTNPTHVRQLYGIQYPFQLTELDLPVDGAEADRDNVRTLCYVEQRSEPTDKDREWVFLASRRREQIVKSTLVLPKEKTPSLSRGKQPPREDPVVMQQGGLPSPASTVSSATQQPKKKRRRAKQPEKKEAALGTFGRTQGWLFARSTTQHVPVSETPGVAQRMINLLIDGVVGWEQGIINEDEELEASFKDTGDSEQLLEREMCTRATFVATLPEKADFGIFRGYHDMVTADGYLTPHFLFMFDEFVMQAENLEQTRQQMVDPTTEGLVP